MTEIRTLPELERLLRPLAEQELSELEASVLRDGIRDPVVVCYLELELGSHKCYYDPARHGEGHNYGDGPCKLEAGDGVWTCSVCEHSPAPMEAVLLDGHHRYLLAKKHSLEYETAEVDISTIAEARRWVIRNQLGRRNLTPDEASYYRGLQYEEQKKQGERTDLTSGQNVQKLTTAEEVAKEHNVDEKTIRRDAQYARAVDELAAVAGVQPLEIVQNSQITKQDVLRIQSLKLEQQKHVVHRIMQEGNSGARGIVHRVLGTGENEWYTPEVYAGAAREVLGDIDLDPASTPKANETIKAKRIYTIDDDGLNQAWEGRVFLNPPYTQPHIKLFVEKLVEEHGKGNVGEAILLTHNYTDTAWFHAAASCASVICFTRGRIHFISPEGVEAAPTQGQAFFYLGKNVRKFADVFKQFGFLVTPHAE